MPQHTPAERGKNRGFTKGGAFAKGNTRGTPKKKGDKKGKPFGERNEYEEFYDRRSDGESVGTAMEQRK